MTSQIREHFIERNSTDGTIEITIYSDYSYEITDNFNKHLIVLLAGKLGCDINHSECLLSDDVVNNIFLFDGNIPWGLNHKYLKRKYIEVF